MADESMKVDGVFEGGGVKGIGLVGAVTVTEEKGYGFENVAGASAGAIVAALIAAGYNAAELKEIIKSIDYTKFKDKRLVDSIPLLGPVLGLGLEKGVYEGNFIEEWLKDLLEKKSITTFADLKRETDDPRYRYKLQVIATDITRGKMLVLPRDILDYGINPDELEVAHAVRMSMSIPFFFEPVILDHAEYGKCYIVDGAVLSNFPVWLFDDGSQAPPWPTFGYKLVAPCKGKPNSITGPITLFAAMLSTMMEAHDAYYLQADSFVRTITIPTLGVRTTDFNISRQARDDLFQSGREAAEDFFQHWDFDRYKELYCRTTPLRRRERVCPKRSQDDSR